MDAYIQGVCEHKEGRYELMFGDFMPPVSYLTVKTK
jgi:hypothetical protein